MNIPTIDTFGLVIVCTKNVNNPTIDTFGLESVSIMESNYTRANITGWSSYAPSKAVHAFLGYHQIFSIVLAVVIVSGNAITLLVLVRNRPLRRKENILIGSMAASDLLVGVLGMLSPILTATRLVTPG